MGLDGVELVMAFEERFGISITDGEAGNIRTPKDVIDLIMSKIKVTDEKLCLSQRAFYLLRNALIRKLGISRNSINPDTDLGKIIPKSDIKRVWKELRTEVQARSWPKLVRPLWMKLAIFICSIGVFSITYLIVLSCPEEIIGNYLTASLSGSFLGILFIFFALYFTRSFKNSIPSRLRRIRNIVPRHVISSEKIKWSKEEVPRHVKQIVIQMLGLRESQYREDADFIKDLGVG